MLAPLMQTYCGAAVRPEDMQLIAEGASRRCIMRGPQPLTRGLIGIYWTPERADNNSFLPAAHGLRRAGIRVPRVLAEQDCGSGCGACLVQDLGHTSLLSLRHAPQEERTRAYHSTLRELHRLHQVRPDWELQPPFDAALYRWEQDYFAQYLLGLHAGIPGAAALTTASPAWAELAEWLAALPRTPVHRDCQSQNILMHDGEAYFIDFQGMRLGRPEYDLASLLYDPYADLPPAERRQLLQYYTQLTGTPLREDILAACALQRLMQALGAFAKIGHEQNNPWYLNLIPTGLRLLRQAADAAPPHSPAAHLALCLAPLCN